MTGRADSRLRDAMIFVVSAQRSGTYWLERIVAAHPDVASIPSETYLLSRGIKPLAERLQHGSYHQLPIGTDAPHVAAR